MSADLDPAWHQALAFAVTGRRLDGLGRQAAPDPVALAVLLRDAHQADGVRGRHRVPPELMTGIGAAQFQAALTELQTALWPIVGARTPVLADRALTEDERRLLVDVPPHYGA